MNNAPSPDAQIATIHRDSDGTPKMVEIEARRYTVVGEPRRWFERRDRWWETTTTIPRGKGAGIIDFEVLRVECRLGLNVNSHTRSFDLIRSGAADLWTVREILRAA